MSLQKEDVYETEDLPEDDQQLIEDETAESEEVERIHIDLDEAMKRFRGRLVNADNVDFSDSIARKRRSGYGGGSYVLEVLGPYVDETETIEQKYTRLKCEINDLVETIHLQEEFGKNDAYVVLEDELVSMLETLKAMQISRDFAGHVGQSEEKECAKKAPATVLAKEGVVNGKLVALEDRICRLERMVYGVGGPDDSSKVLKIPVAETVEDLRMRVQLLHPAHVDGLHSRITQLLSKFQQVEEKMKEKGDSEFEQKVDKLYDVMNRWDVACTGLSSAVSRMHDLRKLHEQAEQFSTKLSHVMGIRAQLVKTMENDEMMLFDFRQQTYSSLEKLTAAIANLEVRINKLTS